MGGPGYDVVQRPSLDNIITNQNHVTDFISIFEHDPSDSSDHHHQIHPEVQTTLYDTSSFISSHKNSPHPIIINLNIQCLNSKLQDLKQFVKETVNDNNMPIKFIALQEVWTVNYPNLVNIPDYKFVFKPRPHGERGGGVGIYIQGDIEFKILEEHTQMLSKIFECITIEAKIGDHVFTVSSVYRSPNPPPV